VAKIELFSSGLKTKNHKSAGSYDMILEKATLISERQVLLFQFLRVRTSSPGYDFAQLF